MSEPIPKPKRRLWRRLAAIIAILSIALVSFSYLFEPTKRLDQRLVGRWGIQNDTSAYTLHADGSGRWSEGLDGSGRGTAVEWWIENGDFLVIEGRSDAISNFVHKVENASLRIARSVAPNQWKPSIWNPDDNEGRRCFYLARIEPRSLRCRRVKSTTPNPRLKGLPDGALESFTRQAQ